jgi:hypothetical protein
MFEVEDLLINSFDNAEFDLPTKTENEIYDPVIGTAYAELIVLPNEKTAYSVKDTDQSNGIFRIILRYPIGESKDTIKAKADEIFNVYKLHSIVTDTENNNYVEIIKQNCQEGVRETAWHKLVLDLYYQTFTRR